MTPLNTSSHGFSLLELLLVIATGSILVFGILTIYRIADQNAQFDNAIELINTVKTTIIRMHTGVPAYTQGTNLEDRVIRSGSLTSKNSDGTNIITLFSNGSDSVVIDSTANTFDITFNNVPQNICIKLFTGYDFDTAGFDSFLYNSTVINNPTPIMANAQCSESASSNQLTWRFR